MLQMHKFMLHIYICIYMYNTAMKNRPPIVDGLFYPFLVGKKNTEFSVLT